ncbi:linear amide C-N hydrolase [bacterium]|nr:MAG: linear amide C-N hydrolase [bacterium]
MKYTKRSNGVHTAMQQAGCTRTEKNGEGLRMKKNLFGLIFIMIFLFLSCKAHACSVFQVTDRAGNVRCGRNFDWNKDGGTVWFIPADAGNHGFLVIEQEGFDYPYEGMNDQGLFIAIAAVPKTKIPFSILKPIRVSCELVTIVLREAGTVEQAIPLFHKYSIMFGTHLGYPLIHYMIVDEMGNSAIVELVDKKIVVTRNKNNNYQVMTNFYVSHPEITFGGKNPGTRYTILEETLSQEKPSQELVWHLLHEVSQKSTVWSNVYDLNKQLVYISYKDEGVVAFSMKEQLYQGAHGYYLSNLDAAKPVIYIPRSKIFMLRPEAGYGLIGKETIFHAGVRLLLDSGENKRYGIDLTYFQSKSDKFVSIGIVLEQVLFGWFNSSIGTIGYLDYGEDNEALIGITSNLGWEPDNHIPIKPFVTWRNDIIFGSKIENVNSISIGFDFVF